MGAALSAGSASKRDPLMYEENSVGSVTLFLGILFKEMMAFSIESLLFFVLPGAVMSRYLPLIVSRRVPSTCRKVSITIINIK